jgi:hypothetical protein
MPVAHHRPLGLMCYPKLDEASATDVIHGRGDGTDASVKDREQGDARIAASGERAALGCGSWPHDQGCLGWEL